MTGERPWSADLPAGSAGLSDLLSVDVCVVGAGIAGLSAAYHAALDGRDVIVLEDGSVASGETGNTTAHLSNAIDDRYLHIEALHGEEGARICAESHSRAIQRYEEIISREQIDCDFRRVDGYLIAREPRHVRQILWPEREAAERAGLSVTLLDQLRVAGHALGPALVFPNQAEIEPLRFVAGLARAIERLGGRIFTGVHVERVDAGRRPRVRTRDGSVIVADHAVVATNSPVNTLVKMHTKQAAYRTYVIAARIPEGSVPRALCWDTGTPDATSLSRGYHYVRLHEERAPDGSRRTLLIVGGEDHRTGQANDADERWQRLEEWARTHFPIQDLVYRWSGQVMEPVDGVAFIGRCGAADENVYIATGDSGMGMTHGMIAGMLISDLIAGRPNRWARLYDPQRISPRATKAYVKENLNTAAQYLDWLQPGEVRSLDEIQPGQGAIVRRGMQLLAVYRDPDSKLHVCSAVCTHLKGIVAWNEDAKSWDCPCHGSRFNVDGEVLNGPASSPLPRQTLKESDAVTTRS
jgi:glycine/D-amino acid oxidase-like deaminating enzyme/nitrite reductase/ring-hydroxylating ferredoxin subunit